MRSRSTILRHGMDVEGYECNALAGFPRFNGTGAIVLSDSDYEFYFNEENGQEFRPMEHPDELPKRRFFLVALARD